MFAKLYALFAYLGVMALPASFIIGFKYDATAPASNYVYDIVLYVIYIGIHFLMTVPAFKKAVYGKPQGAPHERRVYVTVAIVTWIVLYVSRFRASPSRSTNGSCISACAWCCWASSPSSNSPISTRSIPYSVFPAHK